MLKRFSVGEDYYAGLRCLGGTLVLTKSKMCKSCACTSAHNFLSLPIQKFLAYNE